MGDDNQATLLNPGWTNSMVPFSWHPDASQIQTGDMADFRTNKHVGGLLCHAPYPFRTIQGAIKYVCTRGPHDNLQPGQHGWMLGALVDAEAKRIAWIVIHCLPGLYSDSTALDPETGLRWNGEDHMPIELPYGISLQGASALDTIIDARNDPQATRSHAIEIVEPGAGSQFLPPQRDYLALNPLAAFDALGVPTHAVAPLARTFIDGFTIRGAAVLDDPNVTSIGARFLRGAGVAMRRRLSNGWNWDQDDYQALALAPTISNCFINHCGVGIAVTALEEYTLLRTWRPLIVNNTFADNTYVDIYNGSTDFASPPVQASAGRNQLRVLNNICMRTTGLSPTQCYPFTGMHESDLRVVLPVAPFSFNAYADTRPNMVPNYLAGQDWTDEWPAALVDPNRIVQPPVGVPLPPVVDLALLSSEGFFINRAFVESSRGPIAPHDYRLAPWSLAVFNPQLDPTGMPNPMVNVGVTLAAAGGIMVFANRLWIDDTGQPAGLPQLASDAFNHADHPAPMPIEPFQLFDAWDTDCDGFANARIYLRPGFQNNGYGGIDLGADELGELVLSGYLDDTRMFVRAFAAPPAPAVAPSLSRPQMFFFNVPGTGPHPRPQFNAVFGGMHWSGATVDWFLNVQTNPMLGANNYSIADMMFSVYWRGSWRSAMLTYPSTIGAPKYWLQALSPMLVPRSFMSDFSAMLPPDIHPLWASFGDPISAAPTGCPPLVTATPSLIGPLPTDLYASNPWYVDGSNYRHQRQPADLTDPAVATTCDLTIAIDNPFAYYNPSSGTSPDPGYPRSSAQVPTRLSNPTSGVINPPGTLLDMNLVGGSNPVAPRLDVYTFGRFPFGPFTPCVNTSSTTYEVDQQGIGDNATGCPDEVPNLFQGVGIRINCMLGVGINGVGTSNLQTFLVYSRTVAGDAPAGLTQNSSPSSSQPVGLRPPTPEELRAGVQNALSPTSTSGGR